MSAADAGRDAAVVEASIVSARGHSFILQLESDRWTARAGALDGLSPKDVLTNAMLVLERVEDNESSVRNAALQAMLRCPQAMHQYHKFIGLKLHNQNREIVLLALELLAELQMADPDHLSLQPSLRLGRSPAT